MTKLELVAQIRKKRSFLCVGLDPDMDKIPAHLLDFDDPIFEFNKQLIEATHHYAVAYKPNFAFYEALGVSGMQSLEKTQRYLKAYYPEVFTIADAKRGDIGNTSTAYAKGILGLMEFDSITVAPYMGKDSVVPFLAFENKFTIVLGLTSNSGASDFQYIQSSKEQPLFEAVLEKVSKWGTPENLMFVVGATQADQLKAIRKIIPHYFLLVPGVGAQGGKLADVAKAGLTTEIGLLVNSSRGIIYADSSENFAVAAAREAKKLAEEMAIYL